MTTYTLNKLARVLAHVPYKNLLGVLAKLKVAPVQTLVVGKYTIRSYDHDAYVKVLLERSRYEKQRDALRKEREDVKASAKAPAAAATPAPVAPAKPSEVPAYIWEMDEKLTRMMDKLDRLTAALGGV